MRGSRVGPGQPAPGGISDIPTPRQAGRRRGRRPALEATGARVCPKGCHGRRRGAEGGGAWRRRCWMGGHQNGLMGGHQCLMGGRWRKGHKRLAPGPAGPWDADRQACSGRDGQLQPRPRGSSVRMPRPLSRRSAPSIVGESRLAEWSLPGDLSHQKSQSSSPHINHHQIRVVVYDLIIDERMGDHRRVGCQDSEDWWWPHPIHHFSTPSNNHRFPRTDR